MKTIDALRLSFGNMRRTKFRSFLTISGVIIGISSILLLVSLGLGLEKITTNQVADMDSLLTMTITQKKETASLEAGSKITDKTINQIKNIENVKNVSPMISIVSSVIIQNTSSEAFTIGIKKENLKQEISAISYGTEFKNQNDVVISRSLADSISITPEKLIGQDAVIKLVDLENPVENTSNENTELKVKISGIEEGQNGNFIYTPLDLITKTQKDIVYSSLKVRVNAKENIDQISQEIKTLGYEVTTVKELIDQIEKVYFIIQIILAVFGAIGLLVATLGIINTMTISLIERIKEIGIMKAIGASDSDVKKIFLFESMLIGLFGGIFGVLIAYGIGTGFNSLLSMFVKDSSQNSLQLFVISYKFSIIMIAFSVFISILAGIYPAMRAKKLNPLEALCQR
ncbi:MAG: FtsX-like permease family protein [Patescibacteria group bacterium]|jgi:putative ABC transport system permease protein